MDTERDIALADLLPLPSVLGIAAGCLVLEQLLLAFAWRLPHGWVALVVGPVLGVLLPIAALGRMAGVSFRGGIRLRRVRAGEALGAVLVAVGSLAPAYGASRALAPWLRPPEDLLELYAGLLPTGFGSLVAGIVAIVVVAPLAEEILFRGLVLPGLGRAVPMPAAIAASALAFGAAHGSLWTMVPVGVLGIALGAIAWRTRGITCAWIAHATFNAFGYAELCVTRDPTTEAVARFATRPLPAAALCLALVVGWWILVRADRGVAAVALAARHLDRGSDPPDHL